MFDKPLFETFIIFIASALEKNIDFLAIDFKFWTHLFVKYFDKIWLYLFNLLYSLFLQKVIYDLFICELNFIFTLLLLIFTLHLARNLSFWFLLLLFRLLLGFFLFIFSLLLARNLSFWFSLLFLRLLLRFFLFIFVLLLAWNLSFWLSLLFLRLFLRFFIFFMCLDPQMQIIRFESSSLSTLLFNEFRYLIIGYLNFVSCYVLFYYLFFRFGLLFLFLLFFFYFFMILLYFPFFGFLLYVCFCLCLFFILWLVLGRLSWSRIYRFQLLCFWILLLWGFFFSFIWHISVIL